MVSKDTLLQALPQYEGREQIVVRAQETNDIIDEVLDAHDYFADDYDKIYKFFIRSDNWNTYRELFEFCKRNLPYDVEPEENQTTKSPAAILETGETSGRDCKHYAGFICGVLSAIARNTGKDINVVYRFASYRPFDKQPEHVFAVVKTANGEIWIDPVLKNFNERLQPSYYVDEKPTAMLKRVSGIYDDYIHDGMPQDFLYNEASVNPVVEQALSYLLYYDIVDTDGNLFPDVFYSIVDTLPPVEGEQVAEAFNVVMRKASIGNIFDDIWHGIKVAFNSPTRLALLSLVGLNMFNMAVKMNKAIADPDGKQKLIDKWYSMGGSWGDLHKAINDGAKHAGVTQINGIGVVPAVVAAWVSLAAVAIAALMPIVNAILQKKGDSTATLSNAELEAALNAQGQSLNSTGGGGVMTFIQQNPIPVILVGGAIAYLFFNSKKKRA